MTNPTRTALDAMSGLLPIASNLYNSQSRQLDQWRYRMLRRVLRDVMRQHDAAQRGVGRARSRQRMDKGQRAARAAFFSV